MRCGLLAHKIMNSHLYVRSCQKYCGLVRRKKFLYLFVKCCVHLYCFFFVSFLIVNLFGFFDFRCVSVFNESCSLVLKQWYRGRKYLLVLYDYPRCNTCSLTEWLCSRRSRIVRDIFIIFFFICILTCSYNCCWQPSNFPFYFVIFTQGGTKHFFYSCVRNPFYVEIFLLLFFKKVQTTSVAAQKCQKY